MDSNQKNSHVLKAAIILVLVLGLLMVVLYAFTPLDVALRTRLGLSTRSEEFVLEHFDRTSRATDYFWKGDYVALRTEIESAVENLKTSDPFYFENRMLEVSLAYIGADTSEKRVLAMKKQLALYHEVPVTGSFLRAGMLNGITGAVIADNDSGVYGEVFGDPEFQQFKVEGNANLSLVNLVNYALSIRPTWQATLQKSRLTDGKWILDNLSKKEEGGGEVELGARARAISEILAEADALYKEAEQYHSYSVRAVALPAKYSLSRATLLDIAARADSSKFSLAKAEYEKIFNYYNNTRASDGSRYVILESPVVAGSIAYANLLARTGTKSSEIKPHLDRVAEIVKNNPEGNATFLFSVKKLWERHVADPDLVKNRYADALAAAEISPAFKELLTEHGWKF